MEIRRLTSRACLLAASAAVVTGISTAETFASFPGPSGRIAFEVNRGISTVNPDGTDVLVLTSNPCSLCVPFPDHTDAPAWSPDGYLIAVQQFRFNEDFQATNIAIMAADGSGFHAITTPCCANGTFNDTRPRWSPDSKMVVFVRSGRIAVVDAVRGETALSPVMLLTAGPQDSAPDWSPDGRRIAFVRDGEIWLMKADGSAPTQLTSDGGNSDPNWSPDGTQIAFAHSGSISIIDISGANERLLVQGSDPAWSPDGSQLAFAASDGIDRIRSDGKGLAHVVDGGDPDWGSYAPEAPPSPPTGQPPTPSAPGTPPTPPEAASSPQPPPRQMPTPPTSSPSRPPAASPNRLPRADLSLEVTGPTHARVGHRITYRVTVSNHGTQPAAGSTVVGGLAPGLRFLHGPLHCSLTKTLRCPLRKISAGETINLTVVVAPTRLGKLSSWFAVHAATRDSKQENNSATVTVSVAFA
jgi:uncharacterized repeat protein (TIGR01451 family)